MNEQENASGAQVPCISLLGYKIVSATDGRDLETKVNMCIRSGFEPLGAPSAIGQYRGTLIQAMIHKPPPGCWVEYVKFIATNAAGQRPAAQEESK